MDMQEPEEQRLEDEPMEPAEEVLESSDEPVLSDTDASQPDEEPASVTPSVEEAEKASVEKEPSQEAASEISVEDETEKILVEGELDASTSEDTETALAEEELGKASTDEVAEVVSSDEEPESKPKPDDDPSDWFVIHCYSGYENKVRHNLEQRIETMGMKDMIFDVVVPTQEEIEVRDGKRRTVERHIFPGYVLVNMLLTEESWYVVRNTPGVTGFVGMGNNPTPLRPEEVAQIIKRMEADTPTVKVTFKVGERVRIIDGPFNDFRGVVAEIDMERTKARVMVSFFGRETPVELDFLQVEKA
jgi:transcriptional antiterminator NusG